MTDHHRLFQPQSSHLVSMATPQPSGVTGSSVTHGSVSHDPERVNSDTSKASGPCQNDDRFGEHGVIGNRAASAVKEARNGRSQVNMVLYRCPDIRF